MQFLGLLVPLLALLATVAFIWLLVLAFQRSLWWGVAVLFLSPFSLVIYAIKYWNESKRPFMIYAGSVASLI